MTNARLIAAFLLIATTPAFSQSSLTRSNVQQALGFEDQTASTLTGWHSYPPGSAAADNSIVHSGRWSVRLQRDAGTAGKFSVLTRSLPVDFTGTAIEFRAYLRLQDVSEFAGLWLRQDADDQVLALENMQSQQVKGTRDWTQYSITLPINPKAQQLFFGVLVSGTGTLWVDDMELLVDGKPIAEAASASPHPGLPPDHEFDSGSQVALSQMTPTQVENMATLARVWGFLKYYHPALTAGQRQWDYELFRIMPAVLSAPDRPHANAEILAWIGRLGPIPVCGRVRMLPPQPSMKSPQSTGSATRLNSGPRSASVSNPSMRVAPGSSSTSHSLLASETRPSITNSPTLRSNSRIPVSSSSLYSAGGTSCNIGHRTATGPVRTGRRC